MINLDNKSFKIITNFKSKVAKSGDRFYFNIPPAYLKNDVLNQEQEYFIMVLSENSDKKFKSDHENNKN